MRGFLAHAAAARGRGRRRPARAEAAVWEFLRPVRVPRRGEPGEARPLEALPDGGRLLLLDELPLLPVQLVAPLLELRRLRPALSGAGHGQVRREGHVVEFEAADQAGDEAGDACSSIDSSCCSSAAHWRASCFRISASRKACATRSGERDTDRPRSHEVRRGGRGRRQYVQGAVRAAAAST